MFYSFAKVFFIIAIILLIPLSSFGATVSEIKQAIVKQSNEMNVDPAIMLSIAKVESEFRQDVKAPSGNVGVFQLLPSTAKRMGFDAYNLDENIKAGITYYKNVYKICGSMELAVAAYNVGPDTVKKCNCVPSYSKKFVSKVMENYKYYKNNSN